MSKVTDNGFEDYRFVHFPNMKGIRSASFLFKVDQEEGKVSFSWAICSPEDNFSRAEGRRLCDEHYESGNVIEGQYLRQASLVQNAMVQIDNLLAGREFPDNISKQDLRRLTELLHTNYI